MEFLAQKFWNNSISDWAISLAIILGFYILSKIVYWFISNIVKKLTAKTKTNLDDLLVEKLEKPMIYGIVITGFYFASHYLHIPNPRVEAFIFRLITFSFALDITWVLSRIVDGIIVEYVVPLTEKSENEFDDHILPVIRKAIKTMIWTLGIIVGLDNLGFDITAMIAGLGIGGLALALAAQDMVKNIFGGIMIFLDKPFKIGDRIQVSGFDGTVAEVGLRSTRLRTLDGRILIIPNHSFSDNNLVNVTSEPSRKVMLNLGLTYDTSPEKMDKALELLKHIGANHQDIIEDNYLVSFNAFGDFSLGILFVYFIRKEADILISQSIMNNDILSSFNKEGLEFAFPTQTIYRKAID